MMTPDEILAEIAKNDDTFAAVLVGMSRLVAERVMDDVEHKIADAIEGDQQMRDDVWKLRDVLFNAISIS